ncbi:MAG: MarR family transcriptional regulator, organic hydroperoxide resistance regulator [Candidatus Dependentiae bacterium]|nr:MarR family transcriptional regulator, organic hydroperoxide resistance regulator [Candidatus Dependentiae bacterium]
MTKLPFGFEKPQDSPGFLLWQTTTLWERHIKKALECFELTHSQFVIMALLLWLCAHECQPTQADLAMWSKLDKMNVSKSLKALTERGLVFRSDHGADLRAKTMQLTEEGKLLVQQIVPLVEAADALFFGSVAPHEEQMLITLFSKLVAGGYDGEK